MDIEKALAARDIRVERRFDRAERRAEELDKQLRSIAALIASSFKLIRELDEAPKEIKYKADALLDTPRCEARIEKLEQKLNRQLEKFEEESRKRFEKLDAFRGRRPTNGHN